MDNTPDPAPSDGARAIARHGPIPTLDQLHALISVEHGQVRPSDVTLYGMVRDELFNLPAFFHYYRSLGVDQFLIFDDGSTDGSREFLIQQPDCAVLTSDVRYGDEIAVCYPDGAVRNFRWGLVLKSAIPRLFLDDQFAVYADADEFIILPAPIATLRELFDALRRRKAVCAFANLVEFYPNNIQDLEGDPNPRSFDDMIRLYPYFDGVPLNEIVPGAQPQAVAISASTRLFRHYRMRERRSWLDRLLLRPKPVKRMRRQTDTIKTPIVRWRPDVWLEGSHYANLAPSSDIVLATAHFKFTHDLSRRIESAVEWNSYAQDSGAYHAYKALLDAMSRVRGDFTYGKSVAYQGPTQLEALGLVQYR